MEKLTTQEEQAMQAIWRVKAGFIKDFMEVIPAPKPVYTTLASTLKKLKEKGFLSSKRYANANRYRPKIKESDYKNRFMTAFVDDYFQSSYKLLIQFFAEQKKISAEELKEITRLIEHTEIET